MSHQPPGLPEFLLGYALEGAYHFAERVSLSQAFQEAEERRRTQLRIVREPEQLELPLSYDEPEKATSIIEDWDLTRHEWGPEPAPEPPRERPRLQWD